MIEIILTRTRTNGKAVHGTIELPFRSGTIIEHTLACLRLVDATLPAAFSVRSQKSIGFSIPEGTYPLERTWSPKFKKMLPEIKDVPDREGIRIHRGSIPEHSKGCILMDLGAMGNIDILFNQIAQDYESETTCITIRSAE